MDKYKNKEELYFSYYLDELKKAGIIKKYSYEEETFELSPKVEFDYQKITQLKTKLKIENKTKTLFQPCTYTPDFIIDGVKTDGKLFSYDVKDMPIFLLSAHDGLLKSFVDVKGVFAGRTNSTQYTFPLKQKWIYDKYKIYTTKIVPDKLFALTFTPKKVIEEEVYRRNDSKRDIKIGDSKLKFKIRTIDEYLNK